MFFEFDHVSFAYGDIKALDDLSFSGERGQIIGLIGENGAGKSTAIKTIVRYLRPDEGHIFLNGQDVFRIRQEKYPVSYIPDDPVFYEELSLMEHLHFTKALFPGNPLSIGEVVDLLELREHGNKIPAALSKGTRQKLMIAIALLREYELLIADEPFSGLDPKQIANLKRLLLAQKEQNKMVILSSHLLDLAENICDRYVMIRRGSILAEGTKEELLSRADISEGASLERIYLKLVEDYV